MIHMYGAAKLARPPLDPIGKSVISAILTLCTIVSSKRNERLVIVMNHQ